MSKISTQVMAAVAAIYAARVLLSATALKLYVLMVAVWGIAKLVWVARVLQNLATEEKSGLASLANFMLEAITHAHPSVQIMLAVAALALVSLFFDVGGARSAPRGARLAA